VEIPEILVSDVELQDIILNGVYEINFEKFDMVQLIREICTLPLIRPNLIDYVVKLCVSCVNNEELFRILKPCLLKSSFRICPILCYRLLKEGLFNANDVLELVENDKSVVSFCIFLELNPKFIDQINVFFNSKLLPFTYQDLFDNDGKGLSQLRDYGFLADSPGYFLKYDIEEVLNNYFLLHDSKSFSKVAWSPFEWSIEPISLSPLSVSAHYGSIKCFKQLLLRNHLIEPSVLVSSMAGNCFEIIHLCSAKTVLGYNCLIEASKHYQSDVFDWVYSSFGEIPDELVMSNHIRSMLFAIQNGANVNFKDIFKNRFSRL